jgi:hypothetical protein
MAKASNSNKTVLQTMKDRGVKSTGNSNPGIAPYYANLSKGFLPAPYDSRRGY